MQSDFIPLGLDVAALLEQYDIQLEALRYRDNGLTLVLVENPGTQAGFDTLQATARQHGLILSRDDLQGKDTWRFTREQADKGER